MNDSQSAPTHTARSFLERLREARFRQLLCSLALLLFFAPFIAALGHSSGRTLGTLLVVSLLAIVMVASALAVSEGRRQTQLTLVFATACLVLTLLAHLLDSLTLRIIQDVSTIAFLVHVVRLIVKHLFRQQHADLDTIAASMCGYLLIGVAFAAVYSLVQEVDDRAISTNVTIAESGAPMRFGGSQTATSLYFSFVTLTTLGYGDITPVSMPARMLATAEALIGQLYLVVLVARLVGLHISENQ